MPRTTCLLCQLLKTTVGRAGDSQSLLQMCFLPTLSCSGAQLPGILPQPTTFPRGCHRSASQSSQHVLSGIAVGNHSCGGAVLVLSGSWQPLVQQCLIGQVSGYSRLTAVLVGFTRDGTSNVFTHCIGTADASMHLRTLSEPDLAHRSKA